MIKNAINRILELAEPTFRTHNDTLYCDKIMHRMDNEQRAESLTLTTLSSLIDYIGFYSEERKDCEYMVHVVSPTEVRLVSSLDRDRKRETLVTVKAELPRIPFGQYIENENMVIMLQSMFVKDENTDLAAVLKFAGTVSSGTISEYGDDGVTQKAVIKHGIKSKAEAIVPSPCILRPYRTFIEVEQPASSFIFRMKEGSYEGVLSELVEADGGAWKLKAMESITGYLRMRLSPSMKVIC